MSRLLRDAVGGTAPFLVGSALLLATVSCSGRDSLLTGVVVDGAGAPVPGARVRLQATAVATVTNEAGSFRLAVPPEATGRAIAAWKEGHLNGGEKVVAGRTEYRLVLKRIPERDAPEYRWASSKSADPEHEDEHACARCHPAVLAEWEQSAHASAATNPLFLAVFEGEDRSGQPTGGPAYRLDFPRSKGNCAHCHVPALALRSPFDADPASARGVDADGIFCDFCHKVQDTLVDESGGRPGILSLKLLRPGPGSDVFFGPLDDVIAGPDSFLPLYRESRYCAPCHHGSFWNVPAYSEFSEWAASSYAKRNVHCQDCHMKLRTGPRRFALKEEGGLVRDPSTLSSHAQYGLDDQAFMRSSVALSATADLLGETVRVQVTVKNVGAGHHVPTGSPMRNMLLLVEAVDARGRVLPLVAGERLPDWAGTGSAARGDYAGLPGKGFAKILADLVEYPADRRQGRQFTRVHPAPYWRPTSVVSDTRIPAEGTDQSDYVFALADRSAPPVTVRTRLLYRRTFRSWGDLDQIKGGELELGSSRATVTW